MTASVGLCGGGEIFSASDPDFSAFSLVSVPVVSLRKAMLPSTWLKDEDRARVGELEGRHADAFCSAVSSRAQPALPLSLRHTLLTEEFLPSSLSQLAWLAEESRAVREMVTCRKEHVEGNVRTSVTKPLCRGLQQQLDPEQP